MSVADRIVQVLAEAPDLDDDQIAERLGIRRQQVNRACRKLVANGTLHRSARIGNYQYTSPWDVLLSQLWVW